DRFGTVFDAPAGTLPADGHNRQLVVELSGSGKAGYPLRLLGLSLGYPMPLPPPRGPASSDAARLVIKDLALASPAQPGFAPPFADGRQLASWHPAAAAPGLSSLPARAVLRPSVGQWRVTAAGSAELSFQLGAAPPQRAPRVASAPIAAEVTLTAPI